jgi:hypothetical protein
MRLQAITIAAAMILAAATPASALNLQNGEYTVDDVTNTGSQIFSSIVVGEGGTAALHVLDGRLVRCSGSVTIGFSAWPLGPGTGVVNVTGNYSRLEANSLVTGTNQNQFNPDVGVVGTLNIEAGGHVRVNKVSMPTSIYPAYGFVNVSGPGSLLEIVEDLSMRQYGPIPPIMTIETGGTVSVGTFIFIPNGSPEIRLEGGTLSLTGPSQMPPPSVLKYNSGSFRFRSGQTLDGAPGFYTDRYGSPPVLAPGHGLIFDGTTTLATSLTLDGGSLRTVRIAVDPATGSVILAGGTLTLTGEGTVIDDGGDFGPDPLTVGDGAGAPARLELRSGGSVKLGAVTVATDGALSFGGEALLVDSLDNSGRVTVMDATLDAQNGLVNNGSLRLARVVVEGDVSSPAGSTIDVTGTVVFNGAFSGAGAFYGSGTVIFNGAFSGTAAFNGTGTAIFNGPASSD